MMAGNQSDGSFSQWNDRIANSKFKFWDEKSSESDFTSVDEYNRLPTHITGALTLEQMGAYQVMFRIEEITSILKQDSLKIPMSFTRLPSPAPIYDAEGKRTNTTEQRFRKSLEDERYRLVEIALKIIPYFVPPQDYVRPTKFQEKYYIPVEQYTGINFVGFLLGPRGNTLRKLQEQSKCKIAIRGRGSVKEGKNATDLPKGATNMEDPLHCLIISDSEEKLQDGIKACQSIIIKAVTSPEGQNDLKRGQLRELAELNGTLREDDRPCTICGLKGHMKYDCPNKQSFAQQIICGNCGQWGHITRDCTFPLKQRDIPPPPADMHMNNSKSRYQATGQINWNSQPNNSTYYNSNSYVNSRFQNASNSQSRYSSSGYRQRIPYDNDNIMHERKLQGGPISYDEAEVTPPTPVVSIPSRLDTQSMSTDNALGINGDIETVPSIQHNAPPGLEEIGVLPDILPTNAPPGLDFHSSDVDLPLGVSNNVNDGSNNYPPGLSGPPGL